MIPAEIVGPVTETAYMLRTHPIRSVAPHRGEGPYPHFASMGELLKAISTGTVNDDHAVALATVIREAGEMLREISADERAKGDIEAARDHTAERLTLTAFTQEIRDGRHGETLRKAAAGGWC